MSFQSSGSGNALWFFIFIIVGIIALVFVARNPNFKKWLDALMKGTVPTGTTPPTDTTTPPPSGGTITGANIYPVVSDLSGQGDVTVRSGGTSHRDNQGFPCDKCAREATWMFNPGTGGDWSVKLGSHGDESGPEVLIEFGNIDTDGGGGTWRCEGPHMDYSDVGGSGSAPAIGGTQVGVKGISWSTGGSTNHHEIWLDESGSGTTWTQIATFDGSSSCGNALACPVPGRCQDTLRLDDTSGHEFISRSLVEIDPSGGSKSGTITTPGGTTTTPPPAADDEEEEEEDEEEEEEETPAPAPTTPPPTPAQCPSRCAPLQQSAPASYTACCAAGGAAVRGTRARMAMRKAMFSAFQYTPDYWKVSRKRRVGNLI